MAMLTKRRILVVLFLLTQIGCTPEYRDAGQYRVVDVDDNFFGLFCQTHQEFYFLQDPLENADPVYLGTCFTPGFITDQLNMPGDPSCFAISESGESMVYLHLPYVCGTGAKAKSKSGGIYLHSALQGDRLLYRDSQISQTWGGEGIGPGAMRVAWVGDTPSLGGAECYQTLVIHADGREEVEGRPDPKHVSCRLR